MQTESTSPTSDRQQEIRAKNAAACPVVQALETVGTPWRLQVLYALRDAELRFNELKRATGARSKTLSDALAVLVEHDVVHRRTEEASPIAVYYGLTEKGDALVDRLDDVHQWATEWMDDVAAPEERTPRFG